MKEKLVPTLLVGTLILFFVGLLTFGYGLTSEVSYTETMQTVMAYGCVTLLVGIFGFISTIVWDNTTTK